MLTYTACKSIILDITMKFVTNFQEKPDLSALEKQVLNFWDVDDTFKKSVEKNPSDNPYLFYDGPPFATGLPHYGHMLGSVVKDVVPRYWTMKGYRVERVWGWDCHGLPIENMIEKELGLKGGKNGIEELGIEKFNTACRNSVLTYDAEWKKVIKRIGRWVDMDNSYKTMDNNYIESVWWGFKELHKKGLIYEGRHVILYCPRCSTPLSNFEIAMDNSYQDVKDTSVYIKFKVKGSKNTYLLAWTTTPWTLPGNVGLAVNKDATYAKVSINGEELILAESRLQVISGEYMIVETLKGSDLVNMDYEPLYDYLPIGKTRAYYVVDADFVSMDDGTGIVHTAAIYGEDDYKLSVAKGLPTVPMLDDEGKFMPFVENVAGKFFKNANPIIIDDLKTRNLLLKTEEIVHSYPFCYRCDTPLYYTAVPALFINVQKIKSQLIDENEKINWYPEHFKHGQFKNILESSPDWNISRSRYWGSPIPVWQCTECREEKIIGSIAELKEAAQDKEKVNALTDLHRPYIDEIKLTCSCGGEMTRVPEVFDCWVESASMPFAPLHYPFENKEKFENSYPAQFISEYIGQVRAWFNVMHRMSVALFGKASFENVVVTGNFLGNDGKKMSKSRKNYPDPALTFEKYGLDALRFYMMSATVMKAESTILEDKDVQEIYRKVVVLMWNVYAFYRMYVPNEPVVSETPRGIMDQWLVSLTHTLVKNVTEYMDAYDLISACREIQDYIDRLSTWYLRRSRDRIKETTENAGVLGWALKQLSLVSAPIMPFLPEVIYKDLTDEESVHLASWPTYNPDKIDAELEYEMLFAREIVEKGHAQRNASSIKIRQPLQDAVIVSDKTLAPELAEIVKEELNIKELKFTTDGYADAVVVKLNTTLTEDLELEGLAREFVRSVQDLRKKSGVKVGDKVNVMYMSDPKTEQMLTKFDAYVKNKALVSELTVGGEFKLY